MTIDGFKSIQEKNATEEISAGLTTYSENVLTTMFPSYVDGLKGCTRRIVYNTRKYETSKGMNFVIGEIGDVHTSGDASIYGAIIRLAQDFMVGHPLIHIDGKSGEYDSPSSAAAPRYLKARISEFAKDVYFNGIDLRAVPMTKTKDFTNEEPIYLIPKIPMALALGNLTVGYGYKSHIPMMDFTTVCDLTMKFAEFYRANGGDFYKLPRPEMIAKYLIPAFPIPNLIKNREELLEAYRQGNFDVPIDVEGHLELNGNSLTLRAVPYGADFGGVVSRIQSEMANKNSKYKLLDYLNTSRQYSTDEAEFYIEFKRGQNPFEVLDKLRPLLRFENKFHPHYNYIRDNRVISATPLTLTYLWYMERYKNIAAGLRYKQMRLANSITKYEAMLIVCDYVDEVINIVRSSENRNAAVQALYDRFEELTLRQAGIIADLQLTVLTKSSKPEIKRQLEQLRSDLNNVMVAFTRIHDSIYDEAQLLKRKYGGVSKTRYSDDFVGYVQFSNWGIIHFFDEDDLHAVLNGRWGNAIKKTIHIYPHRCHKYLLKHGRIVPMTNPSKHITCECVICYPDDANDYTLVLGSDGSTAVIERAIKEVRHNFVLCPITEKFYAIHRNGSITLDNVDNYSKRKTISRGAKTDLIYGLPCKYKDCVVFHMNTTEPNVLRIDRIVSSPDNLGRLASIPTGTMYILDIQSIKTKEIYLNIPDDCRKNLNIDYLLIRNIKSIFKDSRTTYQLDMNKSGGLSKKLKRHRAVRTLFTIDLGD